MSYNPAARRAAAPAAAPALWTTAEVARYLGIPEDRVRKMRADGTGPAYHRIGHRTVRYAPAAVQRWLAARAETGAAA